jgi:hypothetical protein
MPLVLSTSHSALCNQHPELFPVTNNHQESTLLVLPIWHGRSTHGASSDGQANGKSKSKFCGLVIAIIGLTTSAASIFDKTSQMLPELHTITRRCCKLFMFVRMRQIATHCCIWKLVLDVRLWGPESDRYHLRLMDVIASRRGARSTRGRYSMAVTWLVTNLLVEYRMIIASEYLYRVSNALNLL